jgi:hypothetical protein
MLLTEMLDGEHHKEMDTEPTQFIPTFRGSHSDFLRALSLRHAEFWAEQMRLLEQRMAKKMVARRVLRTVEVQNRSGIPLRDRTTIEKAAYEAELQVKTEMIAKGREGGRVPKADPLTKLISTINRANPGISENQLRWKLKEEVGRGIICSANIRSYIEYEKESGQIARMPISALKDRLSRVRKKKIRAKRLEIP